MPRHRFLACLLVAMAFGPIAGARAASPLVGQWPLDSSHVVGPSDVTDDGSGNGLALTAPSGTMHFGSASGLFGSYLASANTTTLTVNSPLLAPPQVTLLAWIKQMGDPGNLKYIAGRGDDGFPTCLGSSYALYTGYAANPGLHFYVRSPTVSGLSEVPPNATVFDGQWHLVAGTFDGSNVRLYVDGTPIGSPQPVPDGINYALGGGTSFYVDGYPVAACGTGDWPGQIDEVRVYDRALTQTEIGRLAAAPGPGAPDLVADPPPPPPPPPAQPVPGPHDHTLLGAVTYEPAYSVGDDRNTVLSPFAARPVPTHVTVTLVDATDAAVASRPLVSPSIAGSLYTAALYRFDALGACSGCSVILGDDTGVQDRVPVTFDGEAGQTDTDLVYGRLKSGGSVTGGVATPTSIRPTALRVAIRDANGHALSDTSRLRGCAAIKETAGCRTAARYGYRLVGLPAGATPVVAELDQQTPKGKFVAVDQVEFTLDPGGATVAPDLTALADPPPDGAGRVVVGHLNAVAPFGPGVRTTSQLDAPAGLLRDATVELRSAGGTLIKSAKQFREAKSSGFTSYTMSGLDACADCTMQLRKGHDIVDKVPVTIPTRSPSVTTSDLDFRDGKPAFINGVVQSGTRAFRDLVVEALDPVTNKRLAATPKATDDAKGGRITVNAKLPYRLSGAPVGTTVLLTLRAGSTTLDSRLVDVSPEGQETQAPVLAIPSTGSGRVLQGTVYAAGPFGPGLLAASIKAKLTVVLRAGDGTTQLARASVGRGKGEDAPTDLSYALAGLAACDDCTVELLSGATLEDRTPVTIRLQPAAVTVADLGAGVLSDAAYVQGALIPRHGESVTGVTVQVRTADGKVLADSANIAGDTKPPTVAAHPLYRLGGIPRDAGTVTVVVLAGRTKLASTRVAIPVGAGDAHVPDLQIDVPKAGRV